MYAPSKFNIRCLMIKKAGVVFSCKDLFDAKVSILILHIFPITMRLGEVSERSEAPKGNFARWLQNEFAETGPARQR